MATNTKTLRDLYLDVAGEETITEQQRDQFSHDPIEDDETATVSAVVEDGLDGAVDGAEVEFESVQ